MANTVKWLIAIVTLCVITLLISVEPVNSNQAELDQPLPVIALTDLVTGEDVQLDQLEGGFLLNVWGSWCVACAREHDLLLQLQQSGINIVGIAYMDTADNAMQWLNDKGNPFTRSLLDSEGTLGEVLGIKGAPESYLVDSNGRIRYKHTGILTTENWPTLAAQLERMD